MLLWRIVFQGAVTANITVMLVSYRYHESYTKFITCRSLCSSCLAVFGNFSYNFKGHHHNVVGKVDSNSLCFLQYNPLCCKFDMFRTTSLHQSNISCKQCCWCFDLIEDHILAKKVPIEGHASVHHWQQRLCLSDIACHRNIVRADLRLFLLTFFPPSELYVSGIKVLRSGTATQKLAAMLQCGSSDLTCMPMGAATSACHDVVVASALFWSFLQWLFLN